jgi:hypothetical protein
VSRLVHLSDKHPRVDIVEQRRGGEGRRYDGVVPATLAQRAIGQETLEVRVVQFLEVEGREVVGGRSQGGWGVL